MMLVYQQYQQAGSKRTASLLPSLGAHDSTNGTNVWTACAQSDVAPAEWLSDGRPAATSKTKECFLPLACRWWLSWPSRRRRRGRRAGVRPRRGSGLWGCCLVCCPESWRRRDASRNTHSSVFMRGLSYNSVSQWSPQPHPIPSEPYFVFWSNMLIINLSNFFFFSCKPKNESHIAHLKF